MYNPNCHDQPRSTSDSLFQCALGADDPDHGGVHGNSGVPNQLFSILSDGGNAGTGTTTITGIGAFKALYIHLRALSFHTTASQTFLQHASALTDSCNELLGQPLASFVDGSTSGDVISAADCAQVAAAISTTGVGSTPCTGGNNNTLPEPNYLFRFPSAVPVPFGIEGLVTNLFFIGTGSWPELITCGWNAQGSTTVLSTAGFTVLLDSGVTLGICPVPISINIPETYNFGVVTDGVFEPFDTVELYLLPDIYSISPSSGSIAGGETITVTGFFFREFTGCNIDAAPDVNGDAWDCAACYFGMFPYENVVAATVINNTHVTCKAPSWNNLYDPYAKSKFALSLNGYLFFFPRKIYYTYAGVETCTPGPGACYVRQNECTRAPKCRRDSTCRPATAPRKSGTPCSDGFCDGFGNCIASA